MTEAVSLLLIDLGSLFWAAHFSSANEPVSEAHDRCVRKIRWLRGQFEHEHCAIACDSPRSLRKEKHPTYKSARPAKDLAALEQLERVKLTLAADGLLLWEASGYEADDVICVASREASEREMTVLIVSADKDLLALCSESVSVHSPKTNVTFGEREVLEKLGVRPNQVRDLLALVGDASDSVKGVPGVGAKTAAELLKTYGTIEVMMLELARNPNNVGKPAVRKSLQESTEILKVAIDLVTLRTDAPINFDELFEERKVIPLRQVDEAEFEEVDEPSDADESWPIPEVNEAPPPPQDSAPKEQPRQSAEETPIPRSAPKPTEIPRETTLAVVPQRNFDLSLQPETISGAFKLATGLFNSRLYNRFPSPEAIMAVMMRGREMGMGALTSLDNFHLVEGRPAPTAHLLIARAMAHEDCEYLQYIEGDATYALYESKSRRFAKPTRLKYTMEEAKKAGFRPGSAWDKRPAEMLRKSCAVQLARILYPEATAGLYSIEELSGDVAA